MADDHDRKYCHLYYFELVAEYAIDYCASVQRTTLSTFNDDEY